MIRFNRRFDPNFAALHAAAAKGQIGKTGPLSITAFDPRAAASARHQGFGRAVSRHMIHDFYMAMWGMGVPQKVTSVGTSIVDPAIGVAGEFETAGVTLPFADGRIAAIVTGRISGGKLMETGGKTGIRVNQKVGKVGLDLRCRGCADGFGDVTVLPTSNDPTEIQAKVTAALQADPTIDTVLAPGAGPAGEPAAAAVVALGKGPGAVKVAPFDLSVSCLESVVAGDAVFAIDQKQFLQGSLAVNFLAQHADFGLMPGGNVASGPNLITADRAGQVVELSAQGNLRTRSAGGG